jgi:hypothetical protein
MIFTWLVLSLPGMIAATSLFLRSLVRRKDRKTEHESKSSVVALKVYTKQNNMQATPI